MKTPLDIAKLTGKQASLKFILTDKS